MLTHVTNELFQSENERAGIAGVFLLVAVTALLTLFLI
jgi:hypothetical protein